MEPTLCCYLTTHIFFLCFSVLHHTHTVPSQIPYAHGGVFGPFFFDTPNYGSIEDYLYQEKRKRKEVWRSDKMNGTERNNFNQGKKKVQD